MHYLTHFIQTYAGLSVYYLAFTVPFFLIFWIYYRNQWANRRIQPKPRANRSQFFREIKLSFLTILIITVIDTFLFDDGYKSAIVLFTDFSEHGILYFLATTFMLFVIDDAYFYWSHRALHSKLLYKQVHKTHHKSIDTTPFASFAFHPFETLVQQGSIVFVILFSLVAPLHISSIIFWQMMATFCTMLGHLGYEVYPKWLLTTPILKWIAPATHHNMHHTKFVGNYGLYFRWWDKIMHTEFKDFEATFHNIFKRV